MLLERLEEKFRNRQSSYMMVVILAMLDLAWPSGKAMLNDVVNYFKGFYERRLQVGKKPEKEGLRLFSVSTLTDIEIRRTVIENPVRYLQDFLFYDGNREELRFQDDLLPELTNENTRFAIRKLAYKHLYNYYQTFTTNHLTWDELVNLPPGYAVKASDVAYLSGHNQVKGIHPVEHDGEKAVIVLCTIGGDNYANEWLTDDRRRLKYYLEGRTDRNSGRRKYDPELPTNKAVINSRKDNYSVHVFAREKKGELFHYAGPFVFDQMGTDTSGDKYFILQRKEGKERGNGAVDTGVAGMPSLVNSIYTYVRKKGFVFSRELLANLFLSLKTKPFVILAGISGTGKTKLIELFAEAVGATSDNGRFELIPVRPDWNDSTDLLGYKNLEGKFQPGVLTRVIQRALSDGNNPYFVCLDEMNLARVEYYFSDLLSLLETRRWSGDRIRTSRIFRDSDFVLPEDREEFADLHIPDNLYFVGTVNMDETTHPFSKKVLDRANTIEIVDVNLDNYGEEQSGGGQAGVLEMVNILNSDLRSKYCFLQECLPEYRPIVDSVVGYLIEINDILQEANLHVGYRVRDEICFYMIYNTTFGLMDEDKAFDWQLCQKILPRIQGSSQKIMDILRSLFFLCTGVSVANTLDVAAEANKVLATVEAKWPRSAQKIACMLGRFEEDGFTSFWA